MGEDRPLTEFTEGVENTETTADATDTDMTDTDEAASETPEPLTITYRWQPGGAECVQCGATTEKQWLDGGEFVCPDCKSWK